MKGFVSCKDGYVRSCQSRPMRPLSNVLNSMDFVWCVYARVGVVYSYGLTEKPTCMYVCRTCSLVFAK